MIKQCVGCGYCCMKVICVHGQQAYGVDPQRDCPGLYWAEDKYRCKLIEEHPSIAESLSAGAGCSSVLTGWREDVKERRSM